MQVRVVRNVTSADGCYVNRRTWFGEMVRVSSSGDLVLRSGYVSLADHRLPNGDLMSTYFVPVDEDSFGEGYPVGYVHAVDCKCSDCRLP